MSDLPGEITKAIFVAPAASIRSMRCSLTARGRSTAPSKRLPTGSSSLENASGWMRVPAPAAGMMPHTVASFGHRATTVRRGAAQNVFELRGAAIRCVLDQRPFARTVRDRAQLLVRPFDRSRRGVARLRDQDFLARLEKPIQPGP